MTRFIAVLIFCLISLSAPLKLVFAADGDGFHQSRSKVPVIFVMGLGGDAKDFEKHRTIFKIFEENGYVLLVPALKRAGTIEAQADLLKTEIDRLVPTGRYHMLAKSMGGPIARRAIDKYGLGDRVVSLMSVSSPHYGTPVADAIIEMSDKNNVSNMLEVFFGDALKDYGAAARDITTYSMKTFNERVKNDPHVRYFSMGFYIPEPVETKGVSPITWKTHQTIIDRGGGENDGLVPTKGAMWGEYLGTFEGEHTAQSTPKLYDGRFIYKEMYQRTVEHLNSVYGKPAAAPRSRR